MLTQKLFLPTYGPFLRGRSHIHYSEILGRTLTVIVLKRKPLHAVNNDSECYSLQFDMEEGEEEEDDEEDEEGDFSAKDQVRDHFRAGSCVNMVSVWGRGGGDWRGEWIGGYRGGVV